MSFTVSNSANSLLLSANSPIDLTSAGVYYFRRGLVASPNRKLYIDSSPSAKGSFVQDFDDHSYPITGASIMIVGADEASIKTAFASYSALIKQQVGLILSIANESGSPFANCVNTAFEMVRRPDGRMIVPNDDGGFRSYVMMDFLQLSK